MKIDKPDPRIGAIATDVDVRSLSDADWNALYRAWLDGIVLVVRGQTSPSRSSSPTRAASAG